MNNAVVFKNIIRVSIGHGFKLLMGLAIGFILPVIFTIDDFGYYRVFAIYLSYIGVLHLGIVDGVYLKYVGYSVEEIAKSGFSSVLFLFSFFEIVFTLIFIFIAVMFFSGDRQLIFIFFAINILPINLTSMFQFISQITGRFKEFSSRNIIYSILVLTIIIYMYLFKIDDYKFYLLVYTAINYLVVIWYIFTYRIFFLRNTSINTKVMHRLKGLISLGIPLLATNFLIIFILNVPKQIVDFYFDIEVFAIFSFSFGILSLVSLFIGAIGTVMYPTLHSFSKDSLRKNYDNFNGIISIVSVLSLVVFFPISMIIETFLPKYNDAIAILVIVFPILVFNASINIVKVNYYKVLQKLKEFFIASLMAIIFIIIASFSTYFITKSVNAIAFVTLIGVSLWAFLLDFFLISFAPQKIVRKNIFYSISIVLFYSIVQLDYGVLISSLVYLLVISINIYLFSREFLYAFVKLIRK